MFGRYVVGLALCAVTTNLVVIAFAVVRGVTLVAWQALRQKLRPDPFYAYRRDDTATSGGWMQLVTNALFGIVLASFTLTFIALAPVESTIPYYTLGIVALFILQATNVKSKMDAVAQHTDTAIASYAALPWAAIGAPLGWATYFGISVPLSYGDVRALDIIGGALTKAALALGDWLIVRVVAVGLLAIFSINLLMLLLVLPTVARRVASRKTA
jgi:hypothetical protein